MSFVKTLRVIYVTTAFAGALFLRTCGGGWSPPVYAQERHPGIRQGPSSGSYDPYGYTESTNSKLIDGLMQKTEAIDKHLEATDARLNEALEKISFIEGGGSITVAALGILQIIIWVADRKKSSG